VAWCKSLLKLQGVRSGKGSFDPVQLRFTTLCNAGILAFRNAGDMPIEDESYDLVLCTQVLEHCNHPDRIVNECHRVLKKGGTFIVTVPSIYSVHGYPADKGRFMPDGLRHLLPEFSKVEILGELDFAESLAHFCLYGQLITGRMGRVGRMANPLLAFVTQSVHVG
jgi:SAM-dependent methyltransferase